MLQGASWHGVTYFANFLFLFGSLFCLPTFLVFFGLNNTKCILIASATTSTFTHLHTNKPTAIPSTTITNLLLFLIIKAIQLWNDSVTSKLLGFLLHLIIKSDFLSGSNKFLSKESHTHFPSNIPFLFKNKLNHWHEHHVSQTWVTQLGSQLWLAYRACKYFHYALKWKH